MSKCWYCNSDLRWDKDLDYSDVFEEGEGIVAFLTCVNEECKTEVRCSLRNE